MAIVNVGSGFYLDMTYLNIGGLKSGTTTESTATRTVLKFSDSVYDVFIGDFTYKSGVLTGGTLTGMGEYINGNMAFEIYDFSVPVPNFLTYIRNGDTYGALSAMLKGDDSINGGAYGDALGGLSGNDNIRGYGGDDVLFGGDGNDILLGDDGNDDLLGQKGNDILWGGEGNDALDGGDGDDWLNGQDGNDWLYGGAGNDRLTGGKGADWFAFEEGSGRDEVTDFSLAEGDKVNLHKGQKFTLSEYQGSVVIILDSGDQMELIGVSKAAIVAAGASWVVYT